MKADFRVCLDACVLANFGVADLLLKLAERPRQYLPVWSEQILAELHRTQVDRLGWPEPLADSFGRELRTHFPEAAVSGYDHLIEAVSNHPKDRHVLAAAIHARAEVILTFNLKDFPPESVESWGIQARHPQDYLLTLYEMDTIQVVSRLGAIAAERDRDQEDVLLQLGKSIPLFASRLLDDLDLG
jgi:predicted nucleic acid-binding protein